MTPTTICNMALDLVPSVRIISLDENTWPAKVCRLHFPQALASWLEQGDWGFARKRQQLAEMVNDRGDDWAYAYAVPTDMVLPLKVLWHRNSQNGVLPQGWTADVNGRLSSDLIGQTDFDISGRSLYTYVKPAIIEYITKDLVLEQAYAMWIDALVARLAARICMPISKDAGRRSTLLAEAEIAEQRALANSKNRQPQTYGDFIPEAVAHAWGIHGDDPRVGIGGEVALSLPNQGPVVVQPPPSNGGGNGGGSTGPSIYDFPDWSTIIEQSIQL